MSRDDTAAPLSGVAVLSSSCATLTIALRGALDLDAAGTLRCLVDGAAASGSTLVRFDVTDVTCCDAQGLRSLERAAADIAAGGAAVIITQPSGAVTAAVGVAA